MSKLLKIQGQTYDRPEPWGSFNEACGLFLRNCKKIPESVRLFCVQVLYFKMKLKGVEYFQLKEDKIECTYNDLILCACLNMTTVTFAPELLV